MMSLADKAVTSVYKTNEVLRRHAAPIFESEGISAQQYNVLRVLRGAGGHGLPAQELGSRMLQNTPGVTRLLDRLESKGFVTRRRPDIDRRLQLCSITTAGTELLESLDPRARKNARDFLSVLSKDEVQTLMQLLQRTW
jgi:DNA-binding MarR family transcriptional regulator